VSKIDKLKDQLSYLRPKSKRIPVVNAFCTEFEVDNWDLSKFVVNRLVPIVGYHPFPVNELLLMAGAVCRIKPTHLFEWGTHVGKSARIFYETSKWFEIKMEIHTIDLPVDSAHPEHPGKKRGKFIRGIKDVYVHEGDGLSVALEISSNLNNNAKILFFLDGDHSFESIERELTAIMQTHPSANILIHDTFYQSSESRYNVGPYEAINAVLAGTTHSYRSLTTNTGLPGMTLLYRERSKR
jgi:cephalosporin hydroxylase